METAHQSALLCAIGLERFALAEVRAGFELSSDSARQIAAEPTLSASSSHSGRELRIFRVRLACLPPQRACTIRRRRSPS